MSTIDAALTPLEKGRYQYTDAVDQKPGQSWEDYTRAAYRVRHRGIGFKYETRSKVASNRKTPDDVLNAMMQRDGDQRIRRLAAETWLRKRTPEGRSRRTPATEGWEVARTNGPRCLRDWLRDSGMLWRFHSGQHMPDELRIIIRALDDYAWKDHQSKACECSLCVPVADRPILVEADAEPEMHKLLKRLDVRVRVQSYRDGKLVTLLAASKQLHSHVLKNAA